MPSLSALVNHRKNRYKQFAPATPSRVTGADYAPKDVAIQHEALVFHLSSCIISSFSQYSRLFSVIYHRVNHIHSCPGNWKSRTRLTPEGEVALTPENVFILTPLRALAGGVIFISPYLPALAALILRTLSPVSSI